MDDTIMKKWEVIPMDSRETVINIHYLEELVFIYTSEARVGNALMRAFGEELAEKDFNEKGLITSVILKIHFSNENLSMIFKAKSGVLTNSKLNKNKSRIERMEENKRILEEE